MKTEIKQELNEIENEMIISESDIVTKVKCEVKNEPYQDLEVQEEVGINLITSSEFDKGHIWNHFSEENKQNHNSSLFLNGSNFVSHYDRNRSLWKLFDHKQDFPDWFVCLECKPHKILKDSDRSVEKHFEDFSEHYQINPAWFYLRFDLKIHDFALTNGKLQNNPTHTTEEVYPNLKEKSFLCSHCGSCYEEKIELFAHIKEKHDT